MMLRGHADAYIMSVCGRQSVSVCYLGDTLSVDGDADAAVEAKIQIDGIKFRQLVPLLTNRDISLIRRGRLYSSCVRSSMLHESETCPVREKMSGTSASRDENVR